MLLGSIKSKGTNTLYFRQYEMSFSVKIKYKKMEMMNSGWQFLQLLQFHISPNSNN